jgi:hypothetical protein
MSMGFEILNADGSVALDQDSSPPRLIFWELFPYDFSGTRSVPDFDDTKGFLAVSFGLHKHSGFPSFNNVADSTVGARVDLDMTVLPTVDWNNTTKILTVTAATDVNTLNSGASPFIIYLVRYA